MFKIVLLSVSMEINLDQSRNRFFVKYNKTKDDMI